MAKLRCRGLAPAGRRPTDRRGRGVLGGSSVRSAPLRQVRDAVVTLCDDISRRPRCGGASSCGSTLRRVPHIFSVCLGFQLASPPRNESTPDVTPLMTKPATYDEFSSRKSLDTTVFFSRPRFSVVGHIIISEGPGSRSPMLIDFC